MCLLYRDTTIAMSTCTSVNKMLLHELSRPQKLFTRFLVPHFNLDPQAVLPYAVLQWRVVQCPSFAPHALFLIVHRRVYLVDLLPPVTLVARSVWCIVRSLVYPHRHLVGDD